ncbi:MULTISPECIES: glycoside hydrolase family 38 C-terminal domain-containing protein [unclassified Lentimonas]|uniref:glycoside hydrolase family 38 N-terminal domain-containing protein n=1 Tax=unclassified Lentimonas TaxID=2630993 RepID=UPI00132734A4|nr:MULTISPECIES: glycoside hydrolase family 38 C-terminal domain-containing protein [unclassified Lentimonas]CAA6689457.1 Alpha-mannosidase (EC [Lentimonas sp. CC10]CAA6696442.1 Alpha-mannosidase (EC [Lentimonas sp. CC19]CAA7070521.1 Alpha-mannosidase (EC [Lentimonas sp. CC11]
MSTEHTYHYVLSTHWDREFYQDFQGFRYRLVDILDDVLDGFNDGRLVGTFQMDGQSSPMDDYLEVRPERRQEFEQRVQSGQIKLGPWYTMPDLFIPSGESLIRNLEYGMQVARRAGGEPSRVLFCCDVFGMPSQAPQLAKGFDFKMGFIWRGTNRPDIRHLDWVGADGSTLPCYRFGQNSYWGYGVHVRNVNKFDVPPSVERFAADLAHYSASEAACTQPSAVLLFDGIDHAAWDTPHYAQLKPYLAPAEKNGIQVTHTDLDTYADAALADWDKVHVTLEGEQREPSLLKHKATESAQAVLPGTLSNRVWIKQQNHACEILLCQIAEPLAALQQKLLGKRIAPGLFEAAWRDLLRNHFHDSIYGSYSDETDNDMRSRFRQTRRIAEEIIKDCAQRIAANVESESDHCITIFNTLAYPRNEVIEASFFLSTPELAENGFRLLAADDTELNYQILERIETRHRTLPFPYKEPLHEDSPFVRIALPLQLEGTGYQSLSLVAGEPTAIANKIQTAENTLENEHLCVQVSANGTLCLTDKSTGETYTDLLELEDVGDRGGHFFVDALPEDHPIRSSNVSAQIEAIHNGPFSAALKINYSFDLPTEVIDLKRSEHTTACAVGITVTLEADSPQLKVAIDFDNQVKDHWLRVRFPLGFKTEEYVTNTAFDAITRLVDPGYIAEELSEPVPVGFPQESWMAASNQRRGLSILAPGLKEVAARQDGESTTLFLSLLRGTEYFKFVDANPRAQVLGANRFEFAIRPIAGAIPTAALNAEAQQLATEPVLAQTDAANRYKYRSTHAQQLPSTYSLLEVSPEVTVSAFRALSDADYELRLYNASDDTQSTSLQLESTLEAIQSTDLAGKSIDAVTDRALLSLPRKAIQTLRIQ